MAGFSHQFSARFDHPARSTNQVRVSSLEKEIANLTAAIHHWVAGHVQNTCGVRSDKRHASDMYQFPQNAPYDQRYRPSDHFGQQQMRHDPYSNMYNKRWMDLPSFS